MPANANTERDENSNMSGSTHVMDGIKRPFGEDAVLKNFRDYKRDTDLQEPWIRDTSPWKASPSEAEGRW